MNIALWVCQALLAALFLFAGVMKFVIPVAEMTRQIALPGAFLHFVGLMEVLGGLGMILPGLLRIRTGLTPLAAAGLVIIMIGATVVFLRDRRRRRRVVAAGHRSDVRIRRLWAMEVETVTFERAPRVKRDMKVGQWRTHSCVRHDALKFGERYNRHNWAGWRRHGRRLGRH
jgi:uncharacterized membrane protein YphA (DoxX/SURF4 family)